MEYKRERKVVVPRDIYRLLRKQGVTRQVVVWKPKKTFQKDLVSQAYKQAQWTKAFLVATPPTHSISGYNSIFARTFVSHFHLDPLDPEEVVQIQVFADPPREGRRERDCFGLLIEFTDVEKCLEVVERMKADEWLADCCYAFVRDTWRDGRQGRAAQEWEALPFRTLIDVGREPTPKERNAELGFDPSQF